jgi:RNA polymerase sigma-70 factor (ECF subfamily)
VAEEFRQLFDQHYDYVWSSLRRLGVHERDLEDVVHDVFLEVHAKLDTYDRTRPAKPWLFAFAFRFASDYRRLARHRTSLDGASDDTAATDPSAEELLASKDAGRLLQAALATLSVEVRGVLVAYEIDEIPMKDITDALGIPLHTGYSRLRIGRAQCAEAVKKILAQPQRSPS